MIHNRSGNREALLSYLQLTELTREAPAGWCGTWSHSVAHNCLVAFLVSRTMLSRSGLLSSGPFGATGGRNSAARSRSYCHSRNEIISDRTDSRRSCALLRLG